MSQINVAINDWVKKWVIFTRQYPYIRISDITAKRSKVLLWIGMSEKVWEDTKLLIASENAQVKTKYNGYYIYPFSFTGDKETFEGNWPNVQFISADDIRTEILSNLQGKLDYDADISMISTYVTHAVENLYDIFNKTIDNEQINSKHKDIIRQKSQDFIDYVTQQVFGDKGYLYGSLRENLASAIEQGKQPGVVDFTNFMALRAVSEAYSNLYLSDDKGNVYDTKDLDEVIDINKNYVFETIVPKYEELYLEKNLPIVEDNTGIAFDQPIATEADIKDVYNSLTEKVDDIVEKVNDSFYTTFSPEDRSDWYGAIKNYTSEITEEKKISSSLVDPLLEAAINLLDVQTRKIVAPTSTTTSTYSDQPISRDSNRITGWKRYYPEGVTDTERISNFQRYYGGATGEEDDPERTSNFVRYYPGVTDDSQLYANRISGWNRFYPYQAVEEDRISNWKRYYPSNTSTDTRVAGDSWQRYVPSEGSIASDFLPTYRTFSGHDMVVTVQLPISSKSSITKIIGAFQTVTYSISNAKAPVRVLGDMNPKRFVFGPRMIAGSMVLIVFDRHWMRELFDTYVKIKSSTERYFLMDELPGMNITISCVNEYGHNAKLALYDVTIVNEGQIMSINDIYTENTYEFFALNVDYLDRVESTISRQKSKNSKIPVEVKSEQVTALSDKAAVMEVDSLGEATSKQEEVEVLKPPEVIHNYSLNKKYDDVYDDIIVRYQRGDYGDIRSNSVKEKTLSKLYDAEEKEKNERFSSWEKEVYNPKYQDLLSHFKIKETDIKNIDTLKKKLGDNYQEFSSTLTAYQQAYSNMKQLVWDEVSSKLKRQISQTFNMTVDPEDYESGVQIVLPTYEDDSDIPIVESGTVVL